MDGLNVMIGWFGDEERRGEGMRVGMCVETNEMTHASHGEDDE